MIWHIFHASWRRKIRLYKEVYTIIDNIGGKGHYVGTYLAYQPNINGWWGEGEIKFTWTVTKIFQLYGTGTEDYFGGAWNWEQPKANIVHTLRHFSACTN